jgi:hypothetical protein
MGVEIEKLMVFHLVKAFHIFFFFFLSHIFINASKNPAFDFCVLPAETQSTPSHYISLNIISY